MNRASPSSKRKQGKSGAPGATVIRDEAYAGQSEAQKLDIYLPAGAGPYPVIVWIHPGGFFEGDKGGRGAEDPLAMVDMKRLTRPMLARGYAVVSINYRLSHEAQFPSVIHDAKAAVRWVRANASRYGFDPRRVAAWGSSAGGYLAAFLAVSEGVKEVEDLSMGNPDQPSGVVAAVDWYGCTDFLAMDAQTKQLGLELWRGGHDCETSPESLLIGGPIHSLREKCQASNPVCYVKSNHAPIYIQHGRSDNIVPYLQSVLLVDKLKAAAGREWVFEVIDGVGHADPCFFKPANINKVLDFLDKYLK